mmetsp:Transcript_7314/g.7482  ORF Transcript_7314/g.7482 Transcript_7314/m.7482 type:complete len:82 (-) Transcript_7314:1568-1813(-)
MLQRHLLCVPGEQQRTLHSRVSHHHHGLVVVGVPPSVADGKAVDVAAPKLLFDGRMLFAGLAGRKWMWAVVVAGVMVVGNG